MKIYNVYLNNVNKIVATYFSKEQAEEDAKNYFSARVEEGEVSGINIWEVAHTRCLGELIEKERQTLRRYQTVVGYLPYGKTTIHEVLKAQSDYEVAKQAIAEYFSAM